MLEQQEQDRAIRPPRDAPHDPHVPIEARDIFTGHARVHHFQKSVATLTDSPTEGDELLFTGEGSGNRTAIQGDMHRGARCGHPHGTGAHGFTRQARHLRDVLGRGRLVGSSTFPHHIRSQCAVCEKGRHIESPRRGIECIQVFGEGLPLPLHPRAQGIARDIFHAFHQTNEPVAAGWLGGREAHPAVSHHRRRYTVPQGLREIRIPTDLPVVVRMDVNPARRDDETIGIEGARGSPGRLADGSNTTILDGDVGALGFKPTAVHHRSAANQDIELGHGHASSCTRWLRPLL